MWLCLLRSKNFASMRKAINPLRHLTYCSIKACQVRMNSVKYLHWSHGDYTDMEVVSTRQKSRTAFCWWAAKSRGTSPMAQCQLDISHIVLWLLIPDRKSRPRQPCVRKNCHHCSCWQWWRRVGWGQDVQTCAEGQLGEQLNQKPDSCKGSLKPALHSSIKPYHFPHRHSQELNLKSFDAVHFLAQDIRSFSLHNTLFPPKLQRWISSAAMLNRHSCLYYTAHVLGQEATALINALITKHNLKRKKNIFCTVEYDIDVIAKSFTWPLNFQHSLYLGKIDVIFLTWNGSVNPGRVFLMTKHGLKHHLNWSNALWTPDAACILCIMPTAYLLGLFT